MIVREYNNSDITLIYNCLKELRGKATYTKRKLLHYLNNNCNRNLQIYIGSEGSRKIGIISCNKYMIPRYLGYGLEIEEFIILPKYQNMGFGYKMMDCFIKSVIVHAELRKMTIGTDDCKKAGKIYENYFLKTNKIEFVKNYNHL
jgi:hypothetical protein